MIGKKIEQGFNDQIAEELVSAYLYMQMAGYFVSLGLNGMSVWMLAQHDEERLHAYKFYSHISARGGYPFIGNLEIPEHTWESPLAAFRAALAHEEHITVRINYLMKLAHEESDYAAVEFLQWFVREQVEEEETASKIVDDLTRIGASGDGLVLIDRELGARTSITPWPVAAAAAN
ncbi:MAG: ferritin [Elusimicrobiaceae bacterium]|nr:ferritin [Elusimicrobiaceae bacterium]